ncbi:uncharacterized protein LOC117260022 [Epinephelus lanceolatus]
MREAGLRVQPNLSRFTVGAIIRTFRMENRTERQPHSGGKRRVFTPEQETLIVNMVRENNAVTLRQIKQKILADNAAFNMIQNVSLSTLDCVLKRNSLAMKQVSRVPFKRNTDHVKELRRDFVLVKEFFSAWRWKVYERNPQSQVPLVQAMEEACGDISLKSIQGFMRHSRRFFQRCLDRENIACDVDEALWPDRNRRHDDA